MIRALYHEIVQSTWGLIPLNFYVLGHQVMLQVPEDTPESKVEDLQKRANRVIGANFEPNFIDLEIK